MLNIPTGISIHFGVCAIMMGLFDAIGNVFLVMSVQKMDISLFGPLNSFKPAIALVLGIFVVHELPSLLGVFGIFIIIVGSFLLNPPQQKIRLNAGVVYRFLAMLFASLGAVFSKKVILLSSPITALLFWMWIGVPVLFLFCYSFDLFQWHTVIPNIKDYLGVVFMIAGMQFFTLLVFERIHVSYALALFQLSSIVSVVLGKLVFQEKHFLKRIVASVVMVCGALIIIFTRS